MFGNKNHSAGAWSKILHTTAREINSRLCDNGYLEGKPGDYTETDKSNGLFTNNYSDSRYVTREWCSDVIDEIMSDNMSSIDWYCDNCNSYLNIMSTFNKRHGKICKCGNCGYKNTISASNIL